MKMEGWLFVFYIIFFFFLNSKARPLLVFSLCAFLRCLLECSEMVWGLDPCLAWSMVIDISDGCLPPPASHVILDAVQGKGSIRRCYYPDYTIQFIHALESRNTAVMETTEGEGRESHCFSQKWESGINPLQVPGFSVNLCGLHEVGDSLWGCKRKRRNHVSEFTARAVIHK